MVSKAWIGSIVICLAWSTQGFGLGPLGIVKPGCDKCCDVTREDSKPCEVKCDHFDKCGKPLYWKKVCKTYTKAVAAECGCSRKVHKATITQVTFQLVLFPHRYDPDELTSSCTQPIGFEICNLCDEGKYYKKAKCCSSNSAGSANVPGAVTPVKTGAVNPIRSIAPPAPAPAPTTSRRLFQPVSESPVEPSATETKPGKRWLWNPF